MNCIEARKIVEDAIDRDLSDSLRRRLELHLGRCAGCRAFYSAKKAEHAKWFALLNGGGCREFRLPSDFAVRLVVSVRNGHGVQNLLQRLWETTAWRRVAACAAVFLGLLALAGTTAVVFDVKIGGRERQNESTRGLSSLGFTETFPTDDMPTDQENGVESLLEDVEPTETPSMSAVEDGVEDEFTLTERGTQMDIKVGKVVSAGAVVLSAALASGEVDSESCILSGSTERTFTSREWTEGLTFDARERATVKAVAETSGFILYFK